MIYARSIFIALGLAMSTSCFGDSTVKPVFNLGVGQTTITQSGAVDNEATFNAFRYGLHWESEKYLVMAEGISDIHGRYRSLKTIVGFGTRYFKIGGGVLNTEISIPASSTNSYSTGYEHIQADIDTYVENDSYPIYLRITPYTDRNMTFFLDGYHGTESTTTVSAPVPNHGRQETLPVSHRERPFSGYGAEFTYRVSHRSAISLRYNVDKGGALAGNYALTRASVQEDTGGLDFDKLSIEAKSLQLSWVYVYR